jgi:two-component system response regulator RegX3
MSDSEDLGLRRILIVDDDAQFRRTLLLALAVQGMETTGAGGGAEALDILARVTPDVVLLDWRMPGMSGQETCRAIRARSTVPVIVVSSDRSVTGAEVETAGGSDFLAKPFSITELLRRIEIALSA